MKSFSLIVFLSLLILSFSLKDSKHLRKKHNDCNKQNEFQFYSNNITIKDNANIVSFPGYYNERILYNNYTNDNALFIRIYNETEKNLTSPFLVNNTFYYFPYINFTSEMKMNIDSQKSQIILQMEIGNKIDITIQIPFNHMNRRYIISHIKEYVDDINNKIKNNIKDNKRTDNNIGWLYRVLYDISTKPSKYYTAIKNDSSSKEYRSLSYMTTKNLIAYNLSVLIANFIYYFVILVVSVVYFIILKYLGNKCTDFLHENGYNKNQHNYSFFIYLIVISLLICIALSIFCYSDILIIIVFSIDSLLIASSIFFYGCPGAIYGTLGFGVIGFLISFALLPIKSLTGAIWVSVSIGGLSGVIGYFIGSIQIIPFEVIPNKVTVKRPVMKMIE